MAVRVAPTALEMAQFIRPGDALVWGQGCDEPLTLIEALLTQRAGLGGVSAFAGSSFSSVLKPEHTDHISFRSMGANGSMRSLAKTGSLGIVPCHVGQIGRLISDRRIRCDVALVQISRPDADGNHSYGVINDYTRAAVTNARVVVAEVNNQVPFTFCDVLLPGSETDYLLETSRDLVSMPPGKIGDGDRALARFAANYIGDGSILQLGIGAVPDAIAQLLVDRRDLGLHSSMAGDALVDFIEAGAMTNAIKRAWRGVSVTGALIGTRRLYEFAHRNKAILLCNSSIAHDAAILGALPKLVSINSALEVDITGQVNAEEIGGAYIGGTSGQIDFVRGGSRSPGGRPTGYSAARRVEPSRRPPVRPCDDGPLRNRRDRHRIWRSRTQEQDADRTRRRHGHYHPLRFPRSPRTRGA